MTKSPKEFLLADGSGDEYFELLDADNNTIEEGEVIQVARGDVVRISINAFHMSSYEYAKFAKEYTMAAIFRVDEHGQLVGSLSGDTYKPSNEPIMFYPQNGNCILFQEVKSQGKEGSAEEGGEA